MISANIPKNIRRAVYRRDGFRCALCDSNRGLQIHHVIHRSQGGKVADPQNLITLCMYCHNVAHGTRFPECPEYMTPVEIHEACIEYVADFYAPDWYPFETGGL
jgi:hypothetical protein